MKIIYETEDYSEQKILGQAISFYSCIQGFLEDLRQIIKYGEETEEHKKVIQKVRQDLFRKLDEYKIDMEA